MSCEIGSATDYANLLDKLHTFLVKGHALPAAYSGTGTGRLSGLIGKASSVQETITVTWTSATAFSVAGTVSGSLGAGSVGTAFSSSVCAFTAVAGGTAWVSGDKAVFVMTPPWVACRAAAGAEYIWQAPGDGGTDKIFVGASAFSNVSADYYNWRLGGFIGFQSGIAFSSQPGACTGPCLPLWNSAIPYWFIASGKRVIVIAKISTAYEIAYLGFLDAYASPGQWSYPLAVGGSMAWSSEPEAGSTNWRWSYTGTAHRGFAFGGDYSANDDTYSPIRVRKPDGTWRGFAISSIPYGMIWPYGFGMSAMRANLDGSLPLLPIVLAEDMGSVENVFGELSGIAATPGYGNASENTVTPARDPWLVVQNTYRTTRVDYCAVRLG